MRPVETLRNLTMPRSSIDEDDNNVVFVQADCVSGPDSMWFGIPIVMQYTGLKDKAGVEIYEGDVVCLQGIPQSKSPVSYKNGAFVLSNSEVSSEPNLGDLLQSPIWSELEVTGNIYENPELVSN